MHLLAIVKADGYGMKKGTFKNNLKNPNWLLIFCIRCSQRLKVFSKYQIEFAIGRRLQKWAPRIKLWNLQTP